MPCECSALPAGTSPAWMRRLNGLQPLCKAHLDLCSFATEAEDSSHHMSALGQKVNELRLLENASKEQYLWQKSWTNLRIKKKKKSCFFLLLRPTIQRTLREVKSPEITVGTSLIGTVHPLKALWIPHVRTSILFNSWEDQDHRVWTFYSSVVTSLQQYIRIQSNTCNK